jgi:hypothetical protein
MANAQDLDLTREKRLLFSWLDSRGRLDTKERNILARAYLNNIVGVADSVIDDMSKGEKSAYDEIGSRVAGYKPMKYDNCSFWNQITQDLPALCPSGDLEWLVENSGNSLLASLPLRLLKEVDDERSIIVLNKKTQLAELRVINSELGGDDDNVTTPHLKLIMDRLRREVDSYQLDLMTIFMANIYGSCYPDLNPPVSF